MAKPQISQFLKRQDRLVWSRFLSSPEGLAGLNYLRVSFPTKKAVNDVDLIRNGVGFDFWQACVAALEELGEVPERQERADDEQPLEK